MKLLTFLGANPLQSTCYHWQGQECQTKFSSVASSVFLEPDEVFVFLTEDAQQKIYPEFSAELSGKAKAAVTPMPVPLGKDDLELWEIFDQVSGCVKPGEEVAFDVTNGLRHFPLIGLLVAAFLRSALDVNLKAVLYGAFDVGREISPGRTPMFDLTPMLDLLEWSAAADRFNRTGDSRYLASLVDRQRKRLALAAQGDKQRLYEAGALGHLAARLAKISQGLHLIRPIQVMEEADGLSGRIEKARPALAQSAAVQPFSLLLETVERTFAPLGLAGPLEPENFAANLQKQRQMVAWYADRDHWVQAATLAREWLVNWFMGHLDMDEELMVDRDIRQEIENRINEDSRALVNAKTHDKPVPPLSLEKVPEFIEALNIWGQMIELRNDINHAGMRKGAMEPDSLIKQLKALFQRLDRLPLPGEVP